MAVERHKITDELIKAARLRDEMFFFFLCSFLSKAYERERQRERQFGRGNGRLCAVGPGAFRPDDVVTALSGRTIEINNTDAEVGSSVLHATRFPRVITRVFALQEKNSTCHSGICAQ